MIQLPISLFELFAFHTEVVIELHVEQFEEVGSFIGQRAIYVDVCGFVLVEDVSDERCFA